MALTGRVISQTVAIANSLYEEYGDIVHKTRHGWIILPTLLLGYFTYADGYWPVTVVLFGFVLLWIVVSVIEARGDVEAEADR